MDSICHRFSRTAWLPNRWRADGMAGTFEYNQMRGDSLRDRLDNDRNRYKYALVIDWTYSDGPGIGCRHKSRHRIHH